MPNISPLCAVCGRQLSPDDQFCSMCGKPTPINLDSDATLLIGDESQGSNVLAGDSEVTIPDDDYEKIRTVGDAINYIEERS